MCSPDGSRESLRERCARNSVALGPPTLGCPSYRTPPELATRPQPRLHRRLGSWALEAVHQDGRPAVLVDRDEVENRDHVFRRTVLEAELRAPGLSARFEPDRGSRASIVLIEPCLQNIHRILLHSASLMSLERGQDRRPADYFYCMRRKPRRIMPRRSVSATVVSLARVDDAQEGYARLLRSHHSAGVKVRRGDENADIRPGTRKSRYEIFDDCGIYGIFLPPAGDQRALVPVPMRQRLRQFQDETSLRLGE